MNRSVRFLPEALEDLIEIQAWYASRETGLDQAFAEAIAMLSWVLRDAVVFAVRLLAPPCSAWQRAGDCDVTPFTGPVAIKLEW
jgi:hypothetical protein